MTNSVEKNLLDNAVKRIITLEECCRGLEEKLAGERYLTDSAIEETKRQCVAKQEAEKRIAELAAERDDFHARYRESLENNLRLRNSKDAELTGLRTVLESVLDYYNGKFGSLAQVAYTEMKARVESTLRKEAEDAKK